MYLKSKKIIKRNLQHGVAVVEDIVSIGSKGKWDFFTKSHDWGCTERWVDESILKVNLHA
jgi:hypothetical protein